MGNSQEKQQPDYTYLLNKFEVTIKNRCDHLEKRANEFIKNKGYSDMVILNHSMLNIMIIDYFADIDRLKEFHDIEHANKNKITAYTVYWWLRRRPLQVVVNEKITIENAEEIERFVYVNEEFVTSLIIKDVFNINKQDIKGNEMFERYISHVFYYLKYRLLDAQAIEWLLATADVGKQIGKIQASERDI